MKPSKQGRRRKPAHLETVWVKNRLSQFWEQKAGIGNTLDVEIIAQ